MGFERRQVPAGHVALVIGAGPVGLLTAVLARHAGAREVLLPEPRSTRRPSPRRRSTRSPYGLLEHELTLVAARGHETSFPRALAWLPRLQLGAPIVHALALEQLEDAPAIAVAGDCGKLMCCRTGSRVVAEPSFGAGRVVDA